MRYRSFLLTYNDLCFLPGTVWQLSPRMGIIAASIHKSASNLSHEISCCSAFNVAHIRSNKFSGPTSFANSFTKSAHSSRKSSKSSVGGFSASGSFWRKKVQNFIKKIAEIRKSEFRKIFFSPDKVETVLILMFQNMVLICRQLNRFQ